MKRLVLLLAVCVFMTACEGNIPSVETVNSQTHTQTTATNTEATTETTSPPVSDVLDVIAVIESVLYLNRHNPFPEASELEEMVYITSVVLELESGMPVHDYEYCINALASLPNLTELELRDNDFGSNNIGALALLVNLKSLTLVNRHGIGDSLEIAAQLSNLEVLHIYSRHSQIDLSLLKNLVNLKELTVTVQYGGITGFDALSGFIGLEVVVIEAEVYGQGGCPNSENAQVFSALPNLEKLSLYGEFDDLSAFVGLTNLTQLIIGTWYVVGDSGEVIAGARLEEDDMDALTKALPDCEIVFRDN
ncbi:MAG: hypothetical protein FWD34_00960 [Oscillospiraceae bacterium]|nr:hypothetical protein [Oscillospiraceae bacterium]